MLETLRQLLPVVQGDPEQIQSDMGRANAHCQQQTALRQLGHMLPRIIEALEGHDARVTGLIRANSEQVVRRRVAGARLRRCLQALQSAASTFRSYGALHRAKGTEEGDAKGASNDRMADACEEAMTFDPNPADYGRP